MGIATLHTIFNLIETKIRPKAADQKSQKQILSKCSRGLTKNKR